MKLLALDTSSEHCSAALWIDGDVASRDTPAGQNHSSVLLRMIDELPRGITVVLIEHDMDVALGLADRVTVLHEGRVILEGTPDQVRANAEVRDVYFGHG